jgi:hypothetical protein
MWLPMIAMWPLLSCPSIQGCERIQRNQETIPAPKNQASAKPPPPNATSGSDRFGPTPKTIFALRLINSGLFRYCVMDV